VKADKGDFVGRDAALAARGGEKYAFRRFEVLVDDCDPWGDEPLLLDDAVAGFLTSAAYGHRTGKSLALGYLNAAFTGVTEGLEVEVMGARRAVRLLPKAAFDPSGERMRG
jgi:dimethylglycine dehydrogenase